MVIPTQNAVNTWNNLVATTPNLLFSASNNIPPGEIDFESTLLHELGHCIGLAHVNVATESGLGAGDDDYTKSTDGNLDGINNTTADFNLGQGPDGIRGSSDDQRGDDFNLHFFRKSNNNPFTIGTVIDRTTYSQSLADLPVGHSYAANADRSVGALLGTPNTEAVMQQGSFFDEHQRRLNHDDVASIRYAMSGWDELEGTADDYTFTLNYVGLTTACDIPVAFNNAQSTFAVCASGANINSGGPIHGIHATMTTTNVYMNDGFLWFFNDLSTVNVPEAENDDCGEATSIASLPFSEVIDTSVATSEASEPVLSCDSGGGNTV
jgi:hypothetical protein